MQSQIKVLLSSGAICHVDQETLLVGIGPLQWLSKKEGDCFYFPDFFLRGKTPWCKPKELLLVKKDTLIAHLKEIGKTPSLCFEEGDFSLYQKHFLDLHQRNELKKGVCFAFEQAMFCLEGKHLAKLLENILRADRLFPYGFWDEGEGMLGATPEILFDMKDHLVETMACAGSMIDKDDPPVQEEHNLVIEGLKEVLSPLGKLRIDPTTLVSFGALKHWITPVKVDLKQAVSFESLIKRLHPTAALGAFPVNKAMPWLQELEQDLPRGRFGAPCGFTYEGRNRCFVAIRNIQWKKDKIKMGAGGGVVCGKTTAHKEWKELIWKWQSIKMLLLG